MKPEMRRGRVCLGGGGQVSGDLEGLVSRLGLEEGVKADHIPDRWSSSPRLNTPSNRKLTTLDGSSFHFWTALTAGKDHFCLLMTVNPSTGALAHTGLQSYGVLWRLSQSPTHFTGEQSQAERGSRVAWGHRRMHGSAWAGSQVL